MPGKKTPHKTATARKRTRAVSELESHLGFWLRFVSNHVSGQFQRKIEATGVSVSEWVALRYLFRAGASSPGELTDALGMTKGAISKVITRLQEKGWVERAAVDADRRAQQIALTAAGRAQVPILADLADQNDAEFFGHLSQAKRKELIDAMREIVNIRQLKKVPVE